MKVTNSFFFIFIILILFSSAASAALPFVDYYLLPDGDNIDSTNYTKTDAHNEIENHAVKLTTQYNEGIIQKIDALPVKCTYNFTFYDYNTGDTGDIRIYINSSSTDHTGPYFRMQDYQAFTRLNGSVAPTGGTGERQLANQSTVCISKNVSYVNIWIDDYYVGGWTTAIGSGGYFGMATGGNGDKVGFTDLVISEQFIAYGSGGGGGTPAGGMYYYSPENFTEEDCSDWVSGDTAVFTEGTYYEQVWLQRSGTSDYPINITAADGETVTFDRNRINTTATTYNSLGRTVNGIHLENGVDYINISDVNITDCYYGIRVRSSTGVYIENVNINYTNYSAVGFTDCVACSFNNSTTMNTGWNAVQFSISQRDSHDIEIAYNTMTKNPGISPNSGHNYYDLFPYTASYQIYNISIHDNIVNNSDGGAAACGVFTHGASTTKKMDNIQIYNNAFSGGLWAGVYFEFFTNSNIYDNTLDGDTNYDFISTVSDSGKNPENVTIENNTVTNFAGASTDSRIYCVAGTDILSINNSGLVRNRMFAGTMTINESLSNFVFVNGASNTNLVMSSSSKLFSVSTGNVLYNSTGAFFWNPADTSLTYTWNNLYTAVPTTTATISNVSVTGFNINPAASENITFTELATGNSTNSSMIPGDTYVAFSSLDFTPDEGVTDLYFYGVAGTSYLNYPTKMTFSSGVWTESFPNDGKQTTTPETITGVEIHP